MLRLIANFKVSLVVVVGAWRVFKWPLIVFVFGLVAFTVLSTITIMHFTVGR